MNATGTPAVIASGQLGFASTDFTDAPIVDSTAEEVYVFASDDNFKSGPLRCGLLEPCSAVYQLSTSFAAGSAGIEAEIGKQRDSRRKRGL